ncbi:MAG: C-type lectin domain-containing protein [Oligoflexales bacterium]
MKVVLCCFGLMLLTDGALAENDGPKRGKHEQGYFNWNTSEPVADDKKDCAIALANGKWRVEKCGAMNTFACQSTSSPDVWNVDVNKGTFNEQDAKCKAGFEFAAPKSAEDTQRLQAALKDAKVNQAWIYVNDQVDEGKWMTK